MARKLIIFIIQYFVNLTLRVAHEISAEDLILKITVGGKLVAVEEANRHVPRFTLPKRPSCG